MALFRRLLERIKFWRWYLLDYRPIAGAEEPAADPPEDPKQDDPKPADPKADPPEDDDSINPDDDWKAKARKHERLAKKALKERDQFEQQLKKLEDEGRSDQEKALEKAREEAKAEAKAEAEEARKADRLEVAVTRLATKGIGEEGTRFADSEDALLHIERGIARGDIDADDIYDSEGKVNTEALTTALGEILSAKPHLAAGEAKSKPADPDTRKGSPAQRDLESMTPEDHAKRKYGAK